MRDMQLGPVHLGPGVKDGRHIGADPAPRAVGKCADARIRPVCAVPQKEGVAVYAGTGLPVDVEIHADERVGVGPGCISEAPVALFRLLGRRPDVIGRLVLGAEVGRIAYFRPGGSRAVEAINPQLLGRVVTKLLDLLRKPHNLAGVRQDREQPSLAVLGYREVERLPLAQLMGLRRWQRECL